MLVVQNTKELKRIAALPCRRIEDYAGIAPKLTQLLARPNGGMALFPIQAAALMEIAKYGGGLCPIPVGGGKTLITYLAPVVTRAKRPLLLIPKRLFDKTKHDFWELYIHWNGPHPDRYRLESFEKLSRVSAVKLLEDLKPDLIIMDEAHGVKNPKSARTKRLKRYLAAHPETAVVALSGTITKRSIHDYAHILDWALPPDSRPIPNGYGERETWAACLDEKTRPDAIRAAPGALYWLATTHDQRRAFQRGGEDAIGAAREVYRDRLISTPGVIAGWSSSCDASLVIDDIQPPHDTEIEKAFATLRNDWETPDGWPLSDAPSIWRHAREMALGLYYRWDPRPPTEWLLLRKEWSQTCREVLHNNKRHLDSELAVVQAVDAGHYPQAVDALRAWREIKPTFQPNSVPVWMSYSAIDFVESWARRNTALIWVEHTFVMDELERRGFPAYRNKGFARDGSQIRDADPARGSVVASIGSCREGQNLQKWGANLIVTAPPNGERWEQMLGRTHRQGQTADTISATIVGGCYENYAGFWQAVKDATYTQKTLGAPQKLCYSDILVRRLDELPAVGKRYGK